MTKERVTTLLFIMLLVFICYPSVQAAGIMTKQKRIILDPGHSGKFPGLISPAGILEAQVTQELAEMIAQNLPDTLQVSLTHPLNSPEKTETGTPEQRAAIANKIRADLFISIHLQQSRSQTPLIFYLDSPLPARKKSSRQMAEITAKSFKTRQNYHPRIFKARIIQLENLLMPGILIEPVSISNLSDNPADRKKELTPYAKTIASAIRAFLTTEN